MKLYLMRHGDALAAYEDSLRPLSELGLQEVQAVARRRATEGFSVGRLLHSPKVRARQTAHEVLRLALAGSIEPEEVSGLLPMDPPEVWLDRLEEAEDDWLLVGHNPFMSELAELLVKQPVEFQTATMACFERQGNYLWKRIELP